MISFFWFVLGGVVAGMIEMSLTIFVIYSTDGGALWWIVVPLVWLLIDAVILGFLMLSAYGVLL